VIIWQIAKPVEGIKKCSEISDEDIQMLARHRSSVRSSMGSLAWSLSSSAKSGGNVRAARWSERAASQF
jgi:hypothetical protein